MGGLAGQVRFDGGGVDRSRLAAACALQAHRITGDRADLDGDGVSLMAGGTLGLCIDAWVGVDAATGLFVTFEGDLHNRAALATLLQLPSQGANAPANAVQLLAAGYRAWGEGLANRLEGDFALVIWDPKQACAYAATDCAGVRPLFFVHEPGVHFSFASEAEALAVLVGLDGRTPESRLVEQLVGPLEMLEYGEPLVRGVQRLPAAHWGLAKARQVTCRRYWSPGDAGAPGLLQGDVAGWQEGFDWHLRQAVEKCLGTSGEAFGVMFSGGLDSSAVLALASGGGQSVPTFSLIDSSDPACPESHAIDSMNRHCTTDPMRLDVTQSADSAIMARQFIAVAPRYLSGRAAFLHVNYARAAAQGVHLMMDGLDADTLLSHGGLGEWLLRRGRLREFRANGLGYRRLRGHASVEFDLARCLMRLITPFAVREQLGALRARSNAQHWMADGLLGQEAIDRFDLKGRSAHLMDVIRAGRAPRQPHRQSSMSSLVTIDGLARNNARAAQHGVQLRHPFMDRALVDFCAWLPLDLRMRDGWPKWIMRKGMQSLLPHDVAWRRDKSHIGAKFDRMVLQPVLERLVLDLPRGAAAVQRYIDVAAVQQAASEWQQGQLSAVWRLTPILLLEHWLQHNRDKVDWDR